MKYPAIVAGPLLLSAILSGSLLAQNPRAYMRASVAVVQLKTAGWLSLESVAQRSVAAGYYIGRSHAIELGWARFNISAEAAVHQIDHPTGAVMRSTAAHISYQYEPSVLRVGPIQPFVALGAARTWVAHRTEYDVVTDNRIHSTANAVDAAVGIRTAVVRWLQLIGRAGYRHTEDVQTPITPTGAFGEIGLALSW